MLRDEPGEVLWERDRRYTPDQRTSSVNIVSALKRVLARVNSPNYYTKLHFAGTHEHTVDESSRGGGIFTRVSYRCCELKM